MWRLAEGTFAILLEAGVVAAFCVAVSSVAGPVIVAVSALVFAFAAHTRGILLAPEDPLYSFYPSLDALNVINPVAHGQGVGLSQVLPMLLVFGGWTGLLLLVSAGLFARRDL
jgi:ABC-type transport system involved in multi-copper enzyme maturation permease subunit